MATSLNKNKRADILCALLKRRFEADIKAQTKRQAVAALSAYKVVFPDHAKLQRADPRWLRQDWYLSLPDRLPQEQAICPWPDYGGAMSYRYRELVFNGTHGPAGFMMHWLDMSRPPDIFKPMPHNTAAYMGEIDGESLRGIIMPIIESSDALCAAWNDAVTEARPILDQSRSLEALIKTWPEVEKVARSAVEVKPATSLMVVTEKLNASLRLP